VVTAGKDLEQAGLVWFLIAQKHELRSLGRNHWFTVILSCNVDVRDNLPIRTQVHALSDFFRRQDPSVVVKLAVNMVAQFFSASKKRAVKGKKAILFILAWT